MAFSISIIFQYKNFQNDKVHIREEFTQLKKEQIKREVLSVYNLIEQKAEELLINSVKAKLKERVGQANNLAMNIYNENKDTKTQEEIELLIARAINNINYETQNIFFINSNKGRAILFNKTELIHIKMFGN